MANLDGRQIAAVIKRESSGTPIIMLTGWGTLINEEGTATPNIDAILSKPPRAKEMQDTLRRVLKKQTARK